MVGHSLLVKMDWMLYVYDACTCSVSLTRDFVHRRNKKSPKRKANSTQMRQISFRHRAKLTAASTRTLPMTATRTLAQALEASPRVKTGMN